MSKTKTTMTTVNKKLTSDEYKTAQTRTAITATFEHHRQTNPETGAEYWSARTLMLLFGYISWQKFYTLIERAMKSCETQRWPSLRF